MEPKDGDRGRTGARLPAWVLATVGVIAGVLVPAVVALVLFASVVLHRPLLGRVIRAGSAVSSARLMIGWAVGLVAIAAVQAGGAVLGMGSITSPAGLAPVPGSGLPLRRCCWPQPLRF